MTDAGMKADLQRYLQRGRDALLWKLEGLGEYDARRPMTPTGTNLLGLVKHLAYVELGYFGDTFGRPFPGPQPWLDDDADPTADMWATAEESREEIVALYRRAWAHADATIEALPLEAAGRVPWWQGDRAGGERCTRSSCTSSPRPIGTPVTPTSSASRSTARWGCGRTPTTCHRAWTRPGGATTASDWSGWPGRRAAAEPVRPG